MYFKNIENYGQLAIEFDKIDGPGKKVTKEFLSRLLEKTIRNAFLYAKDTRDNVFSYREKQLHSVICPAISELTHSFLIEHPLKRKPSGENEYTGNVDYWVSYNHFSYLIELKHAYCAYRSNRFRRSIFSRFSGAIEQLKNIRKAECENLCQGDKKIFKIGLEAITFFRRSSEKEKLIDFEEKAIVESFQKLKDLSPLNEANIFSLWIMPKTSIEQYECSGCYEIYPAVGFIGKIFQ